MWSKAATAELSQMDLAYIRQPPTDLQILYFFLGSNR